MMMKYWLMSFIALLNISCVSWAGDTAGSKDAILAKATSLVSAFKVKNQGLSVIKGDMSSAKEGNGDVLSALQSMNIDIASLDYEVNMYVKHYAQVKSVYEDYLIGYLYQLTFDDFGSVEQSRLSNLKAKDYVANALPASKAPVICYSFLLSKKLNVLCHLGVKEEPSISAIIDGLK